eukprot:360908-Chlamydomonas_euryale.AAC.15
MGASYLWRMRGQGAVSSDKMAPTVRGGAPSGQCQARCFLPLRIPALNAIIALWSRHRHLLRSAAADGVEVWTCATARLCGCDGSTRLPAPTLNTIHWCTMAMLNKTSRVGAPAVREAAPRAAVPSASAMRPAAATPVARCATGLAFA